MATLNDILGYAEGLADAGMGVSMSQWGMQCAALPNAISTYFSAKLFGEMRLICLILPVI